MVQHVTTSSVVYLHVLSSQYQIKESQRNINPLPKLTGNFYFSSDSETLIVFGEHCGYCLFPPHHRRFLGLSVILWKIDCEVQPTLRFLKISTFMSCDWRLAQDALLLSINFPLPLKINQLGSF